MYKHCTRPKKKSSKKKLINYRMVGRVPHGTRLRAAKIFLSNKLIRNHMQPVVCVCIAMQATQNRLHTVEINKSKWREPKQKQKQKYAHKTVNEYRRWSGERARVSELGFAVLFLEIGSHNIDVSIIGLHRWFFHIIIMSVCFTSLLLLFEAC